MSEPKEQYRTLTSEFLAAASKARHIAHYLYCQTCGDTTDHSLHVTGHLEIYTCPNCGTSQTFKVS